MADTRVVFNATELALLLSGAQGPVYRMLNQKANQVKNAAVDTYVPVRNGGLRESIDYVLKSENGVPVAYISAGIEYAMPVHEGYTMKNGRRIRGRPFLRQALERVFPNQG